MNGKCGSIATVENVGKNEDARRLIYWTGGRNAGRAVTKAWRLWKVTDMRSARSFWLRAGQFDR